MKYEIVFDDIILKQLKKAGKNKFLRNILDKIFDKIENLGPRAGVLIDPQLKIYEVKMKRPPVRLFYKHLGFDWSNKAGNHRTNKGTGGNRWVKNA